jgi:hypothetical protein
MPDKHVSTGKKDALGRTVFKGTRGGLYTLTNAGNRAVPSVASSPVVKAKKIPFARQPTKREIERLVARWAGGDYVEVQALRRRGEDLKNNPAYKHAVQVDWAIEQYMRKFALRSPAMPPKIRNIETGSEFPTLYRAVAFTNTTYDDMIQKSKLEDKGYLAFSRNKNAALQVARKTGRGGLKTVVFRLNVRGVPRGVPWIWFAGTPELMKIENSKYINASRPYAEASLQGFAAEQKKYHKTFLMAHETDKLMETEVLLPPGTLKFIGEPTVERRTIMIDVVYVPGVSF